MTPPALCRVVLVLLSALPVRAPAESGPENADPPAAAPTLRASELPAAPEPGASLAQENGFVQRLALARARADLQAQVYRLAIQDAATVGTWAVRELARDRGLRLWLRDPARAAAIRCYSDQTCDAEIRLAPAELLAQLERLHPAAQAAAGEPPGPGELRRAAEHWPVLWGSGTAARSEQTAETPPPGWENVSAAGLAAARRAAEADACHGLLEKAGELPVTHARRLREFLDSGPAVRAAVLAAFERSVPAQVRFEPDQVAVAEARLSILELIRLLTDVHQAHYEGELFHSADFRDMALLARQEQILAVGLAVPPSSTLLALPPEPPEPPAPAWATSGMSTVGEYAPAEGDALEEPARAAAARRDGIAKLRRAAGELPAGPDRTVAAVLDSHGELADDLAIYFETARAGPPEIAAERVRVPLELPLRRLWWIVRRGVLGSDAEQSGPAPRRPAEREKP